MKNPAKRTKIECARLLNIRTDTMQERIDYAFAKIRTALPGFEYKIVCTCRVNLHDPAEIYDQYRGQFDEYFSLAERKPGQKWDFKKKAWVY